MASDESPFAIMRFNATQHANIRTRTVDQPEVIVPEHLKDEFEMYETKFETSGDAGKPVSGDVGFDGQETGAEGSAGGFGTLEVETTQQTSQFLPNMHPAEDQGGMW